MNHHVFELDYDLVAAQLAFSPFYHVKIKETSALFALSLHRSHMRSQKNLQKVGLRT